MRLRSFPRLFRTNVEDHFPCGAPPPSEARIAARSGTQSHIEFRICHTCGPRVIIVKFWLHSGRIIS